MRWDQGLNQRCDLCCGAAVVLVIVVVVVVVGVVVIVVALIVVVIVVVIVFVIVFGQRPQKETKSCRIGRFSVRTSVGSYIHTSIQACKSAKRGPPIQV